MQQEVDIECVACGCEIRNDHPAGETACGHGNMHYNCSYLGMLCEECTRPLTINLQHQADGFATIDFCQDPQIPLPVQVVPIENIERVFSHENHLELQESSDIILNELSELKKMLTATKTVIMNKLNEMSQEIGSIKQKLLEQNNQILQIKLENMEKELKKMKCEE